MDGLFLPVGDGFEQQVGHGYAAFLIGLEQVDQFVYALNLLKVRLRHLSVQESLRLADPAHVKLRDPVLHFIHGLIMLAVELDPLFHV